MIRTIQSLEGMRSVRRLRVAMALVLLVAGMLLVGRAGSLILIESGAYDVALPDDVVVIEDAQNVEPGTGVMTIIQVSGNPDSIAQAEPTGELGVSDASPADIAPQRQLEREGESKSGVMTRMPVSGVLAGSAQPVPLVRKVDSVTGNITKMPDSGAIGSFVQAKTIGTLGMGDSVPVDTAPQGPVVRATQAVLPINNPGQPISQPVNHLDRTQNAQLRLVPGSPTRIVISAIAVDSPVVEVGLHTLYSGNRLVSQWETADYAVGFNRTSALPGKPGNTVMSGHNNINGEVFRNLSNVRAGDTISVFVGLREFTYIVKQKLLLREGGVSPQQQQHNALWIAPTADERLTLVSCWPYSSSTQRLIVIAVPKPNATTGKP